MKNIKVLIIGLDGATWDVLMPLIKKHKLPTFEKLIKNGSYGILESTIPPVTGGAWLSLATGKTPGKTGIIDFLNKKDESYKLYPTSSNDFKGQSFWDYLSYANKKIGIFEYPMLYPPYKINGFMTSSGAFSLGDNITYPASLKDELEQLAEGFGTSVNYHDKKYEDINMFIYDVHIYLDKLQKWVYYLVKNKEWDLLFLVFSVTDWIQHIMWKHIDENHPLYNQDISPKYKLEFIKLWQRIDQIIKNIISENIIVLLVSDHGFGPNDQTFNLAKWLETKKYMVRKGKLERIIGKITYKIYNKFLSNNTLNRGITNVEVNFKKSKAYCLGHTIPFGAIYINSNNKKEKEEIKKDLIQNLRNLKKDIKKDVKIDIYEPEKIYSGEKLIFLPDIIFTINNWRCTIIEDTFKKPLFEEKPFSTRHTGSHRLEGIFLASGPMIKKGHKVEKVRIYDIAPTILHIFGLPIPSDMDGKVIMKIFENNSEFAKRKPKSVSPSYYEHLSEKQKIKIKIKNIKL